MLVLFNKNLINDRISVLSRHIMFVEFSVGALWRSQDFVSGGSGWGFLDPLAYVTNGV